MLASIFTSTLMVTLFALVQCNPSPVVSPLVSYRTVSFLAHTILHPRPALTAGTVSAVSVTVAFSVVSRRRRQQSRCPPWHLPPPPPPLPRLQSRNLLLPARRLLPVGTPHSPPATTPRTTPSSPSGAPSATGTRRTTRSSGLHRVKVLADSTTPSKPMVFAYTPAGSTLPTPTAATNGFKSSPSRPASPLKLASWTPVVPVRIDVHSCYFLRDQEADTKLTRTGRYDAFGCNDALVTKQTFEILAGKGVKKALDDGHLPGSILFRFIEEPCWACNAGLPGMLPNGTKDDCTGEDYLGYPRCGRKSGNDRVLGPHAALVCNRNFTCPAN